MKKNEKTIEVLNDLIRINKDRVAEYEKAANEEKGIDPDIRNFFYTAGTESRSFVNDLHAEVLRLGGTPVSGITISGKIYLYWLDRKATAGASGEEAIQEAYRQALESGIELPENIARLIERQSVRLVRSGERMKKYRDERATVAK